MVTKGDGTTPSLPRNQGSLSSLPSHAENCPICQACDALHALSCGSGWRTAASTLAGLRKSPTNDPPKPQQAAGSNWKEAA